MMPSTIRFQKMLFIMVWKVAELFVLLKNITRDLKKLQFIQKTVFYSFLGLIQTLLKPQHISSLVKYYAFWSLATSLEIKESRYLFLIVSVLRFLYFYIKQRNPFFFLIKNTGIAIKDLKSFI